MNLITEKRAETSYRPIMEHYDRHPFFLDESVVDAVLKKTVLVNFWNCIHTPLHRIADIGCGILAKNISCIGRLLPGPDDLTIVGTDISFKSLIGAKTNHSNRFFIQTDSEKLALHNNFFDFVMATGTIHHMFYPNRGLSEILRILKPDHYLYLTVYNRRNVYCFLYKTIGGFFRLLENTRLKFIIRYFFIPAYWVVYSIANLCILKEIRKIHFKEVEMDFYDKFMVPIAHFFDLSDIEQMLGSSAKIARYQQHAAGMMWGFLIQKKGT